MTAKPRAARYILRMVLKSTGEVRESGLYRRAESRQHLKEVVGSPLFSSVTIVKLGAAEKKRADDSDAALAMANSLYAESELHVIHRAEIRHILADHDRVCKERDTALAEVARLREVLIDLLEHVEEPPDSNCRCHLSAPCNDCVDYGGLRRALKEGYAALASKETP